MKSWLRSEDGLAFAIGTTLTAVTALTLLGVDTFGWVARINIWLDPATAVAAASRTYATVPSIVSITLTYLFLLAVLLPGAKMMGLALRHFVLAFTIVFAVSFVCWFVGHNAYIAATPDKRESLGIGQSLGLTGEAGYIVALIAGLLIGNFIPSVARWLAEAASGSGSK